MDRDGNAVELLFCVISTITTYIKYIKDSDGEFSFNNINLCESNVVQIFELIFCDTER